MKAFEGPRGDPKTPHATCVAARRIHHDPAASHTTPGTKLSEKAASSLGFPTSGTP